LIFVFLVTTGHAQMVTSFGPGPTVTSGLWNYTGATSSLSGNAQFGDQLSGATSNTDFSGAVSLTLTMNATSAPTGNFLFILRDTDNDQVDAQFAWAAFLGGGTVTAPLSSNVNFDFSSVDEWTLANVSATTTAISATLDSVQAVPEPSASFLALCLVTGLVLMHIRRRWMRLEGGRAG
jgi:hypothetical protein